MKNYNKLSVWLGLSVGLLFVSGMSLSLIAGVNTFLTSYMDGRAISSLIFKCIGFGGVGILSILFMIFSMIKNDINYSFRGMVMLVASFLFALGLNKICDFGVSLTHGWSEVQEFLITAICYIVLGLGYLAIMFASDNIKARRLIFLLSLFLIFLFGAMLINSILQGFGAYLISSYSLLVVTQILIIVECCTFRA